MGRTAGATNKPKPSDDGMDFDNTIIEGGNPSPKKETRGRPSGGKISVEKETIADKFNILCEGIASLMGYEYIFTAKDFQKEAVALSNIAKIYPPVARVLEFFDPLLIIFGIVSKFRDMKKKVKKQPIQPQPQPQQQTQPPQPVNGLTLMKMGG